MFWTKKLLGLNNFSWTQFFSVPTFIWTQIFCWKILFRKVNLLELKIDFFHQPRHRGFGRRKKFKTVQLCFKIMLCIITGKSNTRRVFASSSNHIIMRIVTETVLLKLLFFFQVIPYTNNWEESHKLAGVCNCEEITYEKKVKEQKIKKWINLWDGWRINCHNNVDLLNEYRVRIFWKNFYFVPLSAWNPQWKI